MEMSDFYWNDEIINFDLGVSVRDGDGNLLKAVKSFLFLRNIKSCLLHHNNFCQLTRLQF